MNKLKSSLCSEKGPGGNSQGGLGALGSGGSTGGWGDTWALGAAGGGAVGVGGRRQEGVEAGLEAGREGSQEEDSEAYVCVARPEVGLCGLSQRPGAGHCPCT